MLRRERWIITPREIAWFLVGSFLSGFFGQPGANLYIYLSDLVAHTALIWLVGIMVSLVVASLVYVADLRYFFGIFCGLTLSGLLIGIGGWSLTYSANREFAAAGSAFGGIMVSCGTVAIALFATFPVVDAWKKLTAHDDANAASVSAESQ